MGGTSVASGRRSPLEVSLFGELVEALPLAVVLVTREGRVDYVNSRASSLLEAAGVGDDVAQRLSGERLIVEGPEGTRRFDLESATLSNGTRLITIQPHSALEETQRERDRLLQLASISEVMPAVLHELKNPLSAITLMTELLVEDSTEDTRERLHAVLSELRRLSLTIDGLGRFRHEVRSVRHWAIDHALREAFALLEPQAAARGIRCTNDVKDMPLLPFEPAAVRAVLFNLVTNSVYACKSGDQIHVSADFERSTSTLTLRVEDTGPGMTPEVRGRCTELFFTTKPRGSGIGLALCAGVAEAVGGQLRIDSSPGAGTRIALDFPITQHADGTRRS